MSAERSEYVMRAYLERVVGGGELDLLDELTHDDMIDHAAVGAGWGEGRQGLRKHASWFRDTIRDPKVTIKMLVAGEDAVVAYWSATGTLRGPFFGRQADGEPATSVATSWFWLRDGKLAEYKVVADPAAIKAAGTNPNP